MAEKQQDHRIRIEGVVVEGDSRRADRGLLFGFIVAIAFLAAGTYLISNGHSTEGVLFVGADLGTLVGSFIYVNRQRIDEKIAEDFNTRVESWDAANQNPALDESRRVMTLHLQS